MLQSSFVWAKVEGSGQNWVVAQGEFLEQQEGAFYGSEGRVKVSCLGREGENKEERGEE